MDLTVHVTVCWLVSWSVSLSVSLPACLPVCLTVCLSLGLVSVYIVDVVLVIRRGRVDVYCNPINYVHLLPLIARWHRLHIHCLPDNALVTTRYKLIRCLHETVTQHDRSCQSLRRLHWSSVSATPGTQLEILEISRNVKLLLEILQISWNLVDAPGKFL